MTSTETVYTITIELPKVAACPTCFLCGRPATHVVRAAMTSERHTVSRDCYFCARHEPTDAAVCKYLFDA